MGRELGAFSPAALCLAPARVPWQAGLNCRPHPSLAHSFVHAGRLQRRRLPRCQRQGGPCERGRQRRRGVRLEGHDAGAAVGVSPPSLPIRQAVKPRERDPPSGFTHRVNVDLNICLFRTVFTRARANKSSIVCNALRPFHCILCSCDRRFQISSLSSSQQVVGHCEISFDHSVVEGI